MRFSTAIEVGQFAQADYFVANTCSFDFAQKIQNLLLVSSRSNTPEKEESNGRQSQTILKSARAVWLEQR